MTVRFVVTLKNKRGLHARASAMLVKLGNGATETKLLVSHKGKEVEAYSIIELLLLGAKVGDTLNFTCCGKHEENLAQAVKNLINTKFGEDQV